MTIALTIVTTIITLHVHALRQVFPWASGFGAICARHPAKLASWGHKNEKMAQEASFARFSFCFRKSLNVCANLLFVGRSSRMSQRICWLRSLIVERVLLKSLNALANLDVFSYFAGRLNEFRCFCGVVLLWSY